MSAVLILIEFLSPECLPIVVKGASFIEGPSCGTVHLLVLATGATTLLSFKKKYYFNS